MRRRKKDDFRPFATFQAENARCELIVDSHSPSSGQEATSHVSPRVRSLFVADKLGLIDSSLLEVRGEMSCTCLEKALIRHNAFVSKSCYIGYPHTQGICPQSLSFIPRALNLQPYLNICSAHFTVCSSTSILLSPRSVLNSTLGLPLQKCMCSHSTRFRVVGGTSRISATSSISANSNYSAPSRPPDAFTMSNASTQTSDPTVIARVTRVSVEGGLCSIVVKNKRSIDALCS